METTRALEDRVESPDASAPRASPVRLIPTAAYAFIVLAPPVIALLLAPEVVEVATKGGTIAPAARAFAGVSLYTFLLGGGHYLIFDRVLPHFRIGRWPKPFAFGACALAMAVTVAIITSVSAPILVMLCPPMAKSPTRLALQGMVISYLWLGGVYAYRRYRKRVAAEEMRTHHAQLAALDARVRLLQTRTNPHFLFNSLNAVMSLIATDPELAEATLGRLSGLFRYALEGSQKAVVPFSDETAIVSDYLLIEKTRFAERLRYSLEIASNTANIRVPPMLLQPLVENAVNHGIGKRVAGGEVKVKAEVRNQELVVTVFDDGGGPEGSTHHGGSGTSMIDLRERLRLLYGGDDRLEAGPCEGGYRATLRLPERWFG